LFSRFPIHKKEKVASFFLFFFFLNAARLEFGGQLLVVQEALEHGESSAWLRFRNLQQKKQKEGRDEVKKKKKKESID
jgi:hypothetical protein